MKTIPFILFITISLSLFSSCQKDLLVSDYQPVNDEIQSNPNHPMKDSIQFLVEKYITRGIPGAQVVIKNDDGWFYYSGGFAGICPYDSINAARTHSGWNVYGCCFIHQRFA